jgi:hypothetical protein
MNLCGFRGSNNMRHSKIDVIITPKITRQKKIIESNRNNYESRCLFKHPGFNQEDKRVYHLDVNLLCTVGEV